METKKKVPTFPIDARDLFKTDREYNAFLHLLHSNGADGMIVNGRDEKTYTKNKKELITYDRNGKILDIHTTQTKDKAWRQIHLIENFKNEYKNLKK